MRDIFIDTNIASHFANPPDEDYKKLIDWLKTLGSLVVSNKLIQEYGGATQHCRSDSNICAIIDILTKTGRLNKKGNNELRNFIIKKHIKKNLRSNPRDFDHIKLVMLSIRKYAISNDNNFIYDVNNFPGFRAMAVSDPTSLDYK